MPVVINDFEIVVAPPASGTRGGGGDDAGEQSGAGKPQPSVTPEEIILVEQVHRERMERVRAD
ncbi:MAG TPA: hypothetical protein VE713_19400 [Pyrinomonadaceae bacterium]|jgi:hypothetical protein|nr:hypothetical protein [Pyrinomonadaceae bacterium]